MKTTISHGRVGFLLAKWGHSVALPAARGVGTAAAHTKSIELDVIPL